MLRGLLFDIDHVFFDGSYWHRLLHQMICRLGKREQFQEFRNQWQINFLPLVYSGEVKYWDAMASFFCSMGLTESEARELLVTSQAKLQYAQKNLRAFPDVNETLTRLQRRGVRLGIITNSIHQAGALQGILKEIRITAKFEQLLTSRSAGRVLPDAEAFEQLVLNMIVDNNEVGYVSTRLDRLQVAQDAGLTPIWLHEYESQNRSADYDYVGLEIPQFRDLLALNCFPKQESHVG